MNTVKRTLTSENIKTQSSFNAQNDQRSNSQDEVISGFNITVNNNDSLARLKLSKKQEKARKRLEM